jgi:hypothetical protein
MLSITCYGPRLQVKAANQMLLNKTFYAADCSLFPPQLLRVEDNKRNKMMKFDRRVVLSNEYLKKQFDAKNPMSKLISKRKTAPHKALHMWKYNRMHQKDIFFSEPLVHGKLPCSIQLTLFFYAYTLKGMCSNLYNTCTLLQECVLTYITLTKLSSLKKLLKV